MKRLFCILILAFPVVILRGADNLKLQTVVIDAGHGGKDPGCVSKDRKTYEKTITLELAKSLSDRIVKAFPDVKVILTRPNDSFVSLDDRAAISNKSDAQLFISIHVNAAASTSPNGFSVHVLGQSSNKNRDLFAYNMDVCKRENAVVQLEEDFSTKYEGFDPSDPESYIFMLLMQNSHLEQSLKFAQTVQSNLKGGPIKVDRGLWQDPFLVLWKTAMPSVLIEVGFISNQDDLSVLRQKTSRDAIADRLFKAFCEYKTFYDGSTSLEKPEMQPDVQDQAEYYAIQILASKYELDPGADIFRGFETRSIKSGDFFKYFVEISNSKETALSKMSETRKIFPDCFLVKIKGETISRFL